MALWGSFPATTKLALGDFPPFFLAAVRCTVAACFVLVLLARSPSDTIRGHGFVNMADRLGAIGGTLCVESAPGRGTTIRGEIPLGSTPE